MKTITIKSDENFYALLGDMTKKLKTTKSDIIRKAVVMYNEQIERERLKKQFKKASQKVKEHSLKLAKETEETVFDGMTDV